MYSVYKTNVLIQLSSCWEKGETDVSSQWGDGRRSLRSAALIERHGSECVLSFPQVNTHMPSVSCVARWGISPSRALITPKDCMPLVRSYDSPCLAIAMSAAIYSNFCSFVVCTLRMSLLFCLFVLAKGAVVECVALLSTSRKIVQSIRVQVSSCDRIFKQ